MDVAASTMTTEAPWTVRRILDWTIGYLKEHGSETPRLDAEVLLAHARRCPRIQLYTQFDEPVSPEQRAEMRGLVSRRAAAEPVAYLVGHREFFSLDFLVTPGVFIPRPDTEILVMAALDAAKSRPSPGILELCAGTGCVSISLAKNLPTAQLTAIELHAVPFDVARRNIDRHSVGDRIQLLQGDLFAPLPPGSRFDLIVSNPPYIPTAEMGELAADIRNHEPATALDGGADGLDVIRRIAAAAADFLNPGGWLLLEFDPAQAHAGTELLRETGYADVEIRPDLAGQARVLAGRAPNG